MDKLPFDHIEVKIRQAAENVSPPYNEGAWNRMEVMLDNEFGKRRRRRLIWWWFPLLFGLTLGSVVYFYTPGSKESIVQQSFKTSANNTEPLSHPLDRTRNLKREASGKKDQDQNASSAAIAVDTALYQSATKQTLKQSVRQSASVDKASSVPLPGIRAGSKIKSPKRSVDDKPTDDLTSNTVDYKKDPLASQPPGDRVYEEKQTKPDDAELQKKQQGDSTGERTTTNGSTADSAKDGVPDELKKPIRHDSLKTSLQGGKKLQPKHKNQPGPYIIISAGTEAVNPGKISVKTFKPVYGGSVGYRFNNALSVEAGFYAGKKIYKAGPDDYVTKSGSYISKVISADAVCIIYNVPLNVRFDFYRSRKTNLFLSTGLSSYLLKREKYDMHFYNPGGMYRRMSYTYKHNKAWFSIVDLSLGYEQRLNKELYIIAEPYVNLPLSGAGEGKVKLYSAGMQVGIKYQPLKKHSKGLSK